MLLKIATFALLLATSSMPVIAHRGDKLVQRADIHQRSLERIPVHAALVKRGETNCSESTTSKRMAKRSARNGRGRNGNGRSRGGWSSVAASGGVSSGSRGSKTEATPSANTTADAAESTNVEFVAQASQGSSSANRGTSSSSTAQSGSTATAAAAAASSSSSSSTSSSSSSETGQVTFYTQGGVAGACGTVHSDSDLIAAISFNLYGNTGSTSSYCGKQVQLTNTDNGNTVTVTIADACESCADNHIDLSTAAFNTLGDADAGVLPVTITWL